MTEKKTARFFHRLPAYLLLAVLLMSSPAPAGALLGPLPPQDAQERAATLYFRCGSSQWLEREQRLISVRHNESYEKALVQALIDGPKAARLSALFPRGTQLLSVIAEGRQLFVTFNEGLMAAYPDEAALINTPGYRAGEGRLRRQLAMAALANTLTESGEYARVQVLVRAETTLTGSLRLSSRYYLEEADTLPDPLARQEALIMQPGFAAEQVMAPWKAREWALLRERLAPGDTAAQNALGPALEASPYLIEYTLTPGVPSPDGSYAVVCATLRYQARGGAEKSLENWPLRLHRAGGCWQLPWTAFRALLEACR